MSTSNFSGDKPINMYSPVPEYQLYRKKIDKAIAEVLNKGDFINGKAIKELEQQLSTYIGCSDTICVSSGTDALMIALMAIKIGPGDEIITTPYTWISTGEVIGILGAKPIFIDIEEDTYNLDISKIEAVITSRTKAIMPVSLYGHMPDFNEINKIAAKYDLVVIEDGAQSFGAVQNNLKSGNVSLIGCTSFFPSKTLGAYGDAGAIFTSDFELAQIMRAIRNHGGLQRFKHTLLGLNSRMDTLQASILKVKLEHFEEDLLQRGHIATLYNNAFEKLKEYIQIPKVKKGNRHAYALYTIRLNSETERDSLVKYLNKNNINVAIFYPMGIHEQLAFQPYGYKFGDFPVTELCGRQVLSLPCYPYLTIQQIQKIINTIYNFFSLK